LGCLWTVGPGANLSRPPSGSPAGTRPAPLLGRAAYPRRRRGRPFREGARRRRERAASLVRRPQDTVWAASGQSAPVQIGVGHLRGVRLERGPHLCWAGPRIHAVDVGAPFVREPAGGARGPPLWLGGLRTLFGPPLDRRPRCKPESATFGGCGLDRGPPLRTVCSIDVEKLRPRPCRKSSRRVIKPLAETVRPLPACQSTVVRRVPTATTSQ